jgi:hypothetical protein
VRHDLTNEGEEFGQFRELADSFRPYGGQANAEVFKEYIRIITQVLSKVFTKRYLKFFLVKYVMPIFGSTPYM